MLILVLKQVHIMTVGADVIHKPYKTTMIAPPYSLYHRFVCEYANSRSPGLCMRISDLFSTTGHV